MNELVKKSTEGIKDKLYSCIESTFEKIESVKHDLSCIYEGVANDLDILNANEEQIPYSEAYNKGLEDAIKLARELYEMPINTLMIIFDGHKHMTDVLDNYDYSEILAKLEAYEKEQEEIKVGDVVVSEVANVMGVVVRKRFINAAHILFRDGSVGHHELKDFKKTGKHIDISSILEQIGGGK